MITLRDVKSITLDLLGEEPVVFYNPWRPVVSIITFAGLSVLVVSAASGALRVELHVAYDPATSTMGGRVVTSAPSRGERRERSLRPRSCRWLLEEFFAGHFDPAVHMGLSPDHLGT